MGFFDDFTCFDLDDDGIVTDEEGLLGLLSLGELDEEDEDEDL